MNSIVSTVYFVSTEYHMLLAINDIVSRSNENLNYIYLRNGKNSKRIDGSLDFSVLPAIVKFWDQPIDVNCKLTQNARAAINEVIKLKTDRFVFFQEQDPLMVLLSHLFSKNGVQVCLFQDGLKPYSPIKGHSKDLFLNPFKICLWLFRNKYFINEIRSVFTSNKYGYLKSIDSLHLTHPKSYKNWNDKPLCQIDFRPNPRLFELIGKLYKYTSVDFKDSGIIFYLNQPLKDNRNLDIELLEQLAEKYPATEIVIKVHPLTKPEVIKKYSSIPNSKILKSPVPAEFFLMYLRNSIIISVSSTALLFNNRENRYFYLYKFFEKEMYHLKRFHLSTPAVHIETPEHISQICF